MFVGDVGRMINNKAITWIVILTLNFVLGVLLQKIIHFLTQKIKFLA